ncbi:ring-finger-containing ubiquitin ligase [Stylonychia lemnae]|uniref:RING-type E3 ubiquitin transferase n=1 Tax=Stylonychia lemnae TaxID=5949 RepID=A0A078ADT2_STYLE|nr:ring-finger-containing ubiquitin ligase [Stylonychia lemnae]|eukprot:CDW79697.1 ring-finger-containing ubiquitin ligase [Stylonychia lemnae]
MLKFSNVFILSIMLLLLYLNYTLCFYQFKPLLSYNNQQVINDEIINRRQLQDELIEDLLIESATDYSVEEEEEDKLDLIIDEKFENFTSTAQCFTYSEEQKSNNSELFYYSMDSFEQCQTAIFRQYLTNMTEYDGIYQGTWEISDQDDPADISPVMLKNSGKSQFHIQFKIQPEVGNRFGHIYFSGSIQSEKYRKNYVDVSFMDPKIIESLRFDEEDIQLLICDNSDMHGFCLYNNDLNQKSYVDEYSFYQSIQSNILKKEVIHILLSILYILEIDEALLLLNGSLWIPQIIRTYQKKSRQGPDMPYVLIMTLNHIFMPFYQRACPQNLFDREPTYRLSAVFILYVLGQIAIVFLQQKIGPRFFIPKRFRINRNAFNYFHKIIDKPENPTPQDVERLEINEQEECVICMNQIIFEVDNTNGLGISAIPTKKAKFYMKTPCNHKYHVQCLKKWMEIRLECPSCRQVIPELEDDE